MTYRIAWDAATELAPDIINGHKSFHGKAYTRHGSALTLECEYVTVRELYSYGTKVAAIYMDADNGPIIIVGQPYLFSQFLLSQTAELPVIGDFQADLTIIFSVN